MLPARKALVLLAILHSMSAASSADEPSLAPASRLRELARSIAAKWETSAPSFVRVSSLGSRTSFPMRMQPSDLDSAVEAHGQVQTIETASSLVLRDVANCIAALGLEADPRDPTTLDIRYKVEIVAQGKLELSIYVSRDQTVLFDGYALRAQKADWLVALWGLATAKDVFAPGKPGSLPLACS